MYVIYKKIGDDDIIRIKSNLLSYHAYDNFGHFGHQNCFYMNTSLAHI